MGIQRGAHSALESQVKWNEFYSGDTGKPLEAWMEDSWWEWPFEKSIWQWDVGTCFVCFYTIDVLNFGAVQSIIFLSLVILLSYLKNHCLTQSQENLFLFSPKSVIAITLSFRSDPFWFHIYTWYEVGLRFYSFARGIQLSQRHLLKRVFFLHLIALMLSCPFLIPFYHLSYFSYPSPGNHGYVFCQYRSYMFIAM